MYTHVLTIYSCNHVSSGLLTIQERKTDGNLEGVLIKRKNTDKKEGSSETMVKWRGYATAVGMLLV